jgi:hypothetical protein
MGLEGARFADDEDGVVTGEEADEADVGVAGFEEEDDAPPPLRPNLLSHVLAAGVAGDALLSSSCGSADFDADDDEDGKAELVGLIDVAIADDDDDDDDDGGFCDFSSAGLAVEENGLPFAVFDS